MDIAYDAERPLRIEQLRDEIMALDIADVYGVEQVSTPSNPRFIRIVTNGTLSESQQQQISDAIAAHIPAPLPPTEREIALSDVLGNLEAAWPSMDVAQKVEALKGAVMWYVQFNVQRPE